MTASGEFQPDASELRNGRFRANCGRCEKSIPH